MACSRAVTSEEAGLLLDLFQAGEISKEDILKDFQKAPYVDMGFAKVDTHRALRKGFPEVIFGQGKTDPQILSILQKLSESSKAVLVTRISFDTAAFIKGEMEGVQWHDAARCLVWLSAPVKTRLGKVCIVSAGTSDLPVAEEAAVTAEVMGNEVDRVYDVGVAGLHRLLCQLA